MSMKQKVLLMGASGSGKTSMRSLIFSNNPASLTSRLGVTIDVEQNHVRFLGDLILNLWDCGGQDSFMQSYLSTQAATIFSNVGVLIYVFDLHSREVSSDLEYFRRCLDALRRYSPNAAVFLLVHKMDLAGTNRESVFERKRGELLKEGETAAPGLEMTVFGTSIFDETLYKAWSRIVNSLIPNAAILSKHLTTLAEVCSATEVILFERTTFLVVATSAVPPGNLDEEEFETITSPATSTTSHNLSESTSTATLSSLASSEASAPIVRSRPLTLAERHQLDPSRYERTSEVIKAFKHASTRMRAEFRALEFEFPEFTAVLDELTKNMYVLVIVHDPTIETAAIKMNIQLARSKFEQLQGDSIVSQ